MQHSTGQRSHGFDNRPEFKEFFEKTFPQLYGQARSSGLSHHDAEQVAQDAIIAMLLALRKRKQIKDVSAYLSGTVTKMVKMHFRKLAVKPKRRSLAVDILPAPDNGSKRDRVVDSESEQEVRRAVDALSIPLKEVVQLRYLAGLTYDEIASQLGIKLGTVKSRLNQAIKILETQLKHYYFDSHHREEVQRMHKRNASPKQPIFSTEEQK